MRVISKQSERNVSEIMDMAIEYFSGLFGLEISEHIPTCCAEFQNEIGFVTIQIVQNGGLNEVILTSREWEHQIQDFLSTL